MTSRLTTVPVAVTDMTCVTAFGRGMAEIADALSAMRSGLRPFDGGDVPLAACVGPVDGIDEIALPERFAAYDCRNNRLAEMALHEDDFISAVGTAIARYGAARVGVVLGTSTSGIGSTEAAYQYRARHGTLPPAFDFAHTQELASLSAYIAERTGAEGPAYTISTACSSSTRTFTDGARLIMSGICDAVIAGGVDSLCETSVRGFNSLQLLSPEPCRPNDRNRDGISIGEAGGLALLQRAAAVSDDCGMFLRGFGESADAYHMSSPHPDGAGAIAAMRQALEMARLNAADIGYVNMHGTGSIYNDQVEDAAIAAVLGTDAPCSSTKAFGGHTLGAAGIVEAAICRIALLHGMIPGNLNLRVQDPAFRCRIAARTESARLAHVMTNNFGFGGNNCVLIFSGRS